jgi:hypothetical protein
VTIGALISGIVLLGIYGLHGRPYVAWIRQIGVASQTEGPIVVNSQLFRFFRMIQSCPVAVFTLDVFVLGGHVLLVVFFMAILADFFTFVFYGEVFRFLDVA